VTETSAGKIFPAMARKVLGSEIRQERRDWSFAISALVEEGIFFRRRIRAPVTRRIGDKPQGSRKNPLIETREKESDCGKVSA